MRSQIGFGLVIIMRNFLLFSASCVFLLTSSNAVTAQKVKGATKLVPIAASGKTGSSNSGKSSSTAACSRPNGLTTAEIDAILAVHNKARLETNSPRLVWNCSLADFAQDWAAKGVAQHREFSNYGENIFIAGDPKVAATDGVEKWLTERPEWNNSTGLCSVGKTCTHYTQIVWKNTTQVGCGINRNAAGKWKVVMVCNYDPAGNNQSGAAF